MGNKYFKYGRLKYFFKRFAILHITNSQHFSEFILMRRLNLGRSVKVISLRKYFIQQHYILIETHDRAYKWHINHECRFLQRLAFVTLLIK